jgi:hypothetical protein
LRRFFQKATGDLGQRPKSRPQARNIHNAVFGSFCSNFAKKNGENYLNVKKKEVTYTK